MTSPSAIPESSPRCAELERQIASLEQQNRAIEEQNRALGQRVETFIAELET